MDDKFDLDLYDTIVSNMTTRYLLAMLHIRLDGPEIAEYWNYADEEMFYYSNLNEVANRDDEPRILVFADYLTYIPYGDAGYELFDRHMHDKAGITAAEWRLNAFCEILKNCDRELNPAQRTRLKKFFENRNPRTIHYDNIDEVAAAMFRLRHRVECATKDYQDFESIWEEIFEVISDALPGRKSMPMKTLLDATPMPGYLSEDAEEYVKGFDARFMEIVRSED